MLPVYGRGRNPDVGPLGGYVSYEAMRVAQMVFALSLMFGAFLGGIAVGWWRWGRREVPPRDDWANHGALSHPRINPGLFSAEPDEVEMVLDPPEYRGGINQPPELTPDRR